MPDELPEPCRRIEDGVRLPKEGMKKPGEFLPDDLTVALVDVAKAVCVDALVVQRRPPKRRTFRAG